MNINVEFNNDQIIVGFENECIPNQIYELRESISLTDLVKYISEMDNEIKINPENFEEFRNYSKCENKKLLKIIEYIYKIFDAYNKSYQEVCADKEI